MSASDESKKRNLDKGRQRGKKLPASLVSPWTILTILYKLRAGVPLLHLAKQYGIGHSTIYRWDKAYGHEAVWVQASLIPRNVKHLRQILLTLRQDLREADRALEKVRHTFECTGGRYELYRRGKGERMKKEYDRAITDNVLPEPEDTIAERLAYDAIARDAQQID